MGHDAAYAGSLWTVEARPGVETQWAGRAGLLIVYCAAHTTAESQSLLRR